MSVDELCRELTKLRDMGWKDCEVRFVPAYIRDDEFSEKDTVEIEKVNCTQDYVYIEEGFED